MKLTRIETLQLAHIHNADENINLSDDEVYFFEKYGFVRTVECSDGNYVELTEAGRAALAQGGGE